LTGSTRMYSGSAASLASDSSAAAVTSTMRRTAPVPRCRKLCTSGELFSSARSKPSQSTRTTRPLSEDSLVSVAAPRLAVSKSRKLFSRPPTFSAIHRSAPLRQMPVPNGRIHGRAEDLVRPPGPFDGFATGEEPHREPREERRPKPRRLDHPGPHDLDAEHVGLELHQEIVRRSAAVDPERR